MERTAEFENVQPSKPDEFSYHEVMDRLSMVGDMLNAFVIENAVMDEEPELHDLIRSVGAKLFDAYQMAGKLRYEKFPHVVQG